MFRGSSLKDALENSSVAWPILSCKTRIRRKWNIRVVVSLKVPDISTILGQPCNMENSMQAETSRKKNQIINWAFIDKNYMNVTLGGLKKICDFMGLSILLKILQPICITCQPVCKHLLISTFLTDIARFELYNQIKIPVRHPKNMNNLFSKKWEYIAIHVNDILCKIFASKSKSQCTNWVYQRCVICHTPHS